MTDTLNVSLYRSLLKLARWFDRYPLAKAFLTPPPRKYYDCHSGSWISYKTPDARSFLGAAGTLWKGDGSYYLPASDSSSKVSDAATRFCSLQCMIRQGYRVARRTKEVQDNHPLLFELLKRLAKVKVFHDKYSAKTTTLQGSKSTVQPRRLTLSKLEKNINVCHGALLVGHPANLDWTSQSIILLYVSEASRSGGVDNNNEICGLLLSCPVEKESARKWLWQKHYKLRRLSSLKNLGDIPLYDGGPIQKDPVLLQRSTTKRKLLLNAGRLPSDSYQKLLHTKAQRPTPTILLPGNISFTDIRHVQGATSQSHNVISRGSRIIINQCSWTASQLIEEIKNNWWIPLHSGSYVEDLLFRDKTLLSTPNCAWHKVMRDLGGDFADFSRMNVLDAHKVTSVANDHQSSWVDLSRMEYMTDDAWFVFENDCP